MLFALICTTLLVYWVSKRRKESSLDEVNSGGYEKSILKFGKDVYVGVFYFYTSLLLVLGFVMKDCAVFVLWQRRRG